MLYTTMTIQAVQVASVRQITPVSGMSRLAGFLLFPATFGLLFFNMKQRRLVRDALWRNLCGVALLLIAVAEISACGTSPHVNDPATGTSTLTVTVSDSKGTTHTLPITITIQ